MLIDLLEQRRLCAAGDPLESFGTGGVTTFANGLRNVIPVQVLPLRDGKILVAVGSQYDPKNRYGDFAQRDITPADFVRLNADGSPDTTFGGGGTGAVDTFFDSVRNVVERSDGRFFALGTFAQAGDTYTRYFVARFRAGGQLDTTFGVNGRVELDPLSTFGDQADIARVDVDGGVMAAFVRGVTRRQALARFMPDGSRDLTYGTDGRVALQGESQQRSFHFSDIDFGPAGETYLTGTRYTPQRSGINVVRKLAPDGSIDTSFGTLGSGEVEFPKDVTPEALAVVRGGWVVTASRPASPQAGSYYNYTRLIKFDGAGRLAADFGTGGVAEDPEMTPGVPNQIVEQADGKLITLDSFRRAFSSTQRGTGNTLRYNADGSRDASFGQLRLPGGSTTILTMNTAGDTLLVTNESRVTALATAGDAPGPVTLAGDTITLHGTMRSEKLSVSTEGGSRFVVTRDIWTRRLTAFGVKRTVIDAGAGDDELSLFQPGVLLGGAGDDALQAGFRYRYGNHAIYRVDKVALFGGDGDDTLTFLGDGSAADGGRGDDTITGNAFGEAVSVIRGGAGDDVLLTTGPRGAAGFDLFGGTGNDVLTSGRAADVLRGDAGRDTLNGDASDTFIGDDED